MSRYTDTELFNALEHYAWRVDAECHPDGYRGPEVRHWVQGVIHGYASEQDRALTDRTTTTEGGT